MAQVADNRTDDGPLNKALTTTGTDARFTDLFTVGPPPAGVDVSATNQTTLMMIDATGAGIYATTDDMPDGAEVDLKYDSTGEKIGIATAFLQAPVVVTRSLTLNPFSEAIQWLKTGFRVRSSTPAL